MASNRVLRQPTTGLRILLALASLWLLVCPLPALAVYNLDQLGTPRFVNTLYIDLSKVVQMSKYRSSAGHDYSDDVEHCRSLKHYFMSPDDTTAIVAPVSGTITLLMDEFAGTQIQFTSDLYPDFTFIIFHVAIGSPLVVGQHVQEGQRLGNHAGRVTWSDIAIRVNTAKGIQNASYIETLTDSAFSAFVARGVKSRDELIIPRVVRDAAPYKCSGQEFSGLTEPADIEFVTLTGSLPPVPTNFVNGPLVARTILLTITPPSEVQFMIGSLFVAAALPAKFANRVLVWSASGWRDYSSCDTMPAAMQGQLITGMGAYIVPAAYDLTDYVGTRVYVGYGVGTTVKLACENMFKGTTFSQALTVE